MKTPIEQLKERLAGDVQIVGAKIVGSRVLFRARRKHKTLRFCAPLDPHSGELGAHEEIGSHARKKIGAEEHAGEREARRLRRRQARRERGEGWRTLVALLAAQGSAGALQGV